MQARHSGPVTARQGRSVSDRRKRPGTGKRKVRGNPSRLGDWEPYRVNPSPCRPEPTFVWHDERAGNLQFVAESRSDKSPYEFGPVCAYNHAPQAAAGKS